MSAASFAGQPAQLSAAELAVLRQLDTGPRYQSLDELARATELGRPAVAAAVRVLYWRDGYVTPESPHALDEGARWACTTLGEGRLRREPLRLV
jgi:biotin operon repressor